MTLYVESSAILAALLGEPSGPRVQQLLDSADVLVTSELTLIECDRALIRAGALKKLSEADLTDRRHRLAEAVSAWQILRIADDVVTRARQPFPAEPIRALDAIHLASALIARANVPGLELLTLDDRLRSAATALGLPLQST